MAEWLVTVVLGDGSLALEREETRQDIPIDTRKLEEHLFSVFHETHRDQPGHWLIVLGLAETAIALAPALSFWRTLAAAWVQGLRYLSEADGGIPSTGPAPGKAEIFAFLDLQPPMVGGERIDAPFLSAIWAAMNQVFAAVRSNVSGTLEDWLQGLSPRSRHLDHIHFHLVENRRDEQRPFAFLATYARASDDRGGARHLPLVHALREFAGQEKKLLELLATVHRVARKNSTIAGLLQSGELFHPVALTAAEALTFLQGVGECEAAGILCRIPKWWQVQSQRVAVSLIVGERKTSRVGGEDLLDFTPMLVLDGRELTEGEVQALLESACGLAMIKGKWVAADPKSLQDALALFGQVKQLVGKEKLSFAAAMRLLMGAKTGNGGLDAAEVRCGSWMKEVLDRMGDPTLVRTVKPAATFLGDLRPYQQYGLNWLHYLYSLGFGACLADDMGLGKTVQVLALLQKLRQPGRTSLVVVPASLLENWRCEIERFTPDLQWIIVHPQFHDDPAMPGVQKQLNSCDIAITTYGMLQRCHWLGTHSWFYVICDEAQALKNPAAKKTRAVKGLTCERRMVVTGTPVENRLTDLWSLFDFINPGLLGGLTEFKTSLKGLSDHPQGYGRLRRVVHPYILRRSKMDKKVIADLPDKLELKTYCLLSQAQSVLYQDLVRRLDADLVETEGIKRKGTVLAYLMKFKQLCNHPDHFSGAGGFDPDSSGKFKRLAELCATIREKREKVLVFTQFKEIVAPLAAFLGNEFGAPGLTLHGGTALKKRKEAVARFQSEEYIPFFILSLKAGGVGLNLTAANHVIHFDRWWNPAVENQATDRAFRIGQSKNVLVHKFICRGTVEEKIDLLIDDKVKLSGEILPDKQENWLTELDNRQIHDLFRLSLATTAAGIE
jgi:hypothetical protein